MPTSLLRRRTGCAVARSLPIVATIVACDQPPEPAKLTAPAEHSAYSGDVRVTTVDELRSALQSQLTSGRITIAAGYYQVSGTPLVIQGKNGLTIQGEGAALTKVKVDQGLVAAFELRGTIDSLTMRGLTILSSGDGAVGTAGIYSNQNETFTNIPAGISVGATYDSTTNAGVFDSLNVIDNTFVDIPGTLSGHGLGIALNGATNVRIADNLIRNAGRHSIYQAGSHDRFARVLIEHNLVLDHGKAAQQDNRVAITAARSQGVTIAHNIVVNPYNNALGIEQDTGTAAPKTRFVRLIGNHVLGARSSGDILLTSNDAFTTWGNRCIHRGADTSCRVVKADDGLRGTLTEPALWRGTQAVARGDGVTYVVQNAVLHEATTRYFDDPQTWPYRYDRNTSWFNFQAMEYGAGEVHILQNATLHRVSPADWSYRYDPNHTWFNFQAMTYLNGYVYIVQNSTLHRIDPRNWSYMVEPTRSWAGTRRMVAFRDSLFILQNDCIYVVSANLTTVTQHSC